MADKKHVYITTTLPYVNADPHVGFAMEIIRADALARHYRLKGHEVFLNTGTDEHGAKIYEEAVKEGLDPKSYTDKLAERFRKLAPALGLAADVPGIQFNFIRTTDPHHVAAAQEFWKRCDANGDIYKKLYKVKYCVGCELEKTDSELEKGKCPVHPNRELEIREEENYFFRCSKYTEKLKELYKNNPTLVIPDFRFNEAKALVERGLEDFSISRLKSKMPWGVPVPSDSEQVMYVWFDALVNYISAVGWPADMAKFETWWPVIQYCGKDNNRQQSAMWQAMLMSAGLPNSQHIIINGFINSGGQKMSKSLGNVLSPYDVIETFEDVTDFPEDVLRFVLLHDIPSFEDGDLTTERIKASYAAHLQNGLGNLTSRIMKMAVVNSIKYQVSSIKYGEPYQKAFASFDLHKATGLIWDEISALDKNIQEKEPFKVVKVDQEKGQQLIAEMVLSLQRIAVLLEPFLPHTAKEIQRLIRENKMPEKPLFARLA
ncbi:MAG: methionine--tRNA ligase [bacterium]|nr:methionine--tRNA ligase [bacterium]